MSAAAPGGEIGAHMPALDALRGVAALVVVVGHAVGALFVNTNMAVVISFGILARAAVIVFFVLSGFVIGGSIKASLRAGRFSFVRFGLNRLTRIYPAYLLALLLAWLVAALRQHDLIRSVQPFIAEPMTLSAVNLVRDAVFLFGSGTPMQNANAPVWSLRIEVICYVVAGLLALAAQAGGAMRIAFLAAAAALAAVGVIRLDSAVLGFCAFGVGAMAAFIPVPNRRLFMQLFGLLALVLLAVLAWLPLQAEDPVAVVRSLNFTIFQIATVVASALVIGVIAEETRDRPHWTVRLAPLAPFSYTLFITHVPLIAITLGLFPPPEATPARIGVALLLVLWATIFAALAATIVEQHQSLRRWIAARPPMAGLLAWEARR
jgi:peptidoglycan/LPS O-acetylase OafA/YrhL